MQSPIGPPTLILEPSWSLVDSTGIALLALAAGWAWAETGRRLREADAAVNRRAPLFVLLGLVALSAVALVSFVVSRTNAATAGGGASLLLLVLPASGLALVALLVRLGRASRWTHFLTERRVRRMERHVLTERRHALAESVGRGLGGPIAALERTTDAVHRDLLAKEASATLMAIDAEVARLKRIQGIALGWAPAETQSEVTDVEERCGDLLRRLDATASRSTLVRFFGTEGLRLSLPRRHVDTILWGVLEAQSAAADDHMPVVEVSFTRSKGVLVIDVENNGAPGTTDEMARHDGIEAARLVAGLYGGDLLPADPPYGAKVRIRLPEDVLRTTRPGHEGSRMEMVPTRRM